MYMNAMSAPAVSAARGSVRRGSRISALIADTNSSPVNANAICDQKFTVSQFQVGSILDHVKCVTEPNRRQVTPARAVKMSSGARIQRLMEELPLCAAAAIQRGPSTVTILNSSTSQKPISLRSCWMGFAADGERAALTPYTPDYLLA